MTNRGRWSRLPGEREPNGRLSRRSKSSQHYVYVIGSYGSAVVKIGISKAPEARLSDLQIGSERNLFICGLFPCGEKQAAHELEKALHRRLAAMGRKQRGEWYTLRQYEIDALGEAFAAGGAAALFAHPVLSLHREAA